MPLPFYLSCIAIAVFGLVAWSARRMAWGLPACVVLGTVGVWYVGDVLYNELDVYLETIGKASLTSAWWQVLWFLVAFGLLVKPAHQLVNSRLLRGSSHVMDYLDKQRLLQPEVQHRIDVLANSLILVWLALMGIAVIQIKGDLIGLFAPYLGQKANPWARGQIGGGFSALLSFAGYLQIFLAAAFGVLAAVSTNPRTRNIAVVVCFLTLPYYIFDRARSNMLATVLPGVIAFVFLRLRGGLVLKGVVLLGCYLVVNFWFSFVIMNRTKSTVSDAFRGGGNNALIGDAKHEGLNMLKELAWIDHFIVTGAYLPNHGQRYFADLVNPIPRALWRNKPTIGLDYAVARGQAVVGANGEVTCTVSTGMIGQGVTNFGRFFGPLAAAVLMTLWVAVLARQDLLGNNPGRLILYGCGLILTFNMGRDITLLVLYPFIFGQILFWGWQYHLRQKSASGNRLSRSGDVRSETARVAHSNRLSGGPPAGGIER